MDADRDRKRNKWHHEIDSATSRTRPSDERFPWKELREITNRYLDSKRKLTKSEKDQHITDLIQEHERKEVAIAACAHFLSVETLLMILNSDIRVEPGDNADPTSYFEAIIAAGHERPEALEKSDTVWAFHLISHLTSVKPTQSFSKDLETCVTLLVTRAGSAPQLDDHIRMIVGKICAMFMVELEDHKVKHQWMDAYNTTLWLRNLKTQLQRLPKRSNAKQLLDDSLPTWRAWASWRPHQARLRSLQEIPAHLVDPFQSLIDLEGPDFEFGEDPTLYECLVNRGVNILSYAAENGFELQPATQDGAYRLIERLMTVLSTVCRANSAGTLRALVRLCTKQPINAKMIQIVENLFCAKNDHLIKVALQAYAKTGDLRARDIEGVLGPDLSSKLIKLFSLMRRSPTAQSRKLYKDLFKALTLSGNSISDIWEVAAYVRKTTNDGAEACLQVLETCQAHPAEVAEVIIHGILHNVHTGEADCKAIKMIARSFDVAFDRNKALSKNNSQQVIEFYTSRHLELTAKAQRLEILRISLRAAKPVAAINLSKELEIRLPTTAEDWVSVLPSRIVNFVDIINDEVVEMRFPLDSATRLQRSGMGMQKDQSFSVLLFLDKKGMPAGFCAHFTNEIKVVSDEASHNPWMEMENGKASSPRHCCGRVNRFSYQVSRRLGQYFEERKDWSRPPLKDVYHFVKSLIKSLQSQCVVCGSPIGGSRLRSTTCIRSKCIEVFSHTSTRICLTELWDDPAVVELLLVAAYAAAKSDGPLGLLGNLRVSDSSEREEIYDTLTTMPRPADFVKHSKPGSRHDADGKLTKKELNPVYSKRLFQICHSYHGFLVSAEGSLRIPSMPGDQQFLLASAAPEKEAAFRAHFTTPGATSRVVFHGTPISRLYSILTTGLLNCSGTTLMAHGAVGGSGIYLAEDPHVAWRFGLQHRPSRGSDCWIGNHEYMTRYGVVLGCELVGDHTPISTQIPMSMMLNPGISPDNIFIVQDATMVMVRYVFLVRRNVQAPMAQHIAPAMMSVFTSLRSGVL